jgi:uncharacterized protein with HEPN domain
MQREAKAYLWDIVTAAKSIQTFTAGKDLHAYLADELLRSAVERKFGILGEAFLSFYVISQRIEKESLR